MRDDERARIIDSVPVENPQAALDALVATLDSHGELDEELANVLAVRTGDAIDLWVQLDDERAAWRSKRGLAPSPMPFALGE